jgi:hypothetical protein
MSSARSFISLILRLHYTTPFAETAKISVLSRNTTKIRPEAYGVFQGGAV